MKKTTVRIIACLYAALILLLSFSVSAYAVQAFEGESAALCFYIGGVTNMASYSANIKFDPSVLRFKEKELPYGSASFKFADNGIISLAVIFDAVEGMDFTDYSLVCTCTFDVLTEIDNIYDSFSCEITEAIDSSFKTVDENCIIVACVVSPDGQFDDKEEFSPENQIDVDKSKLTAAAGNESSVFIAQSDNDKGNIKENVPESSELSSDVSYSAGVSEMDGQPAIRFDTSSPDPNAGKHKSMIFIVLGSVFFVVAIVGIVLINIKIDD